MVWYQWPWQKQVAQQLVLAREQESACRDQAREKELQRQQEEHQRDKEKTMDLAKAQAENEVFRR